VIWLGAIYFFRTSTTSPSDEECVASNSFPPINEPNNTPEKRPGNIPFSDDAGAGDTATGSATSSSSQRTFVCHKMTQSQTTYDTKLVQPRFKVSKNELQGVWTNRAGSDGYDSQPCIKLEMKQH
jgi:hypothetical protein